MRKYRDLMALYAVLGIRNTSLLRRYLGGKRLYVPRIGLRLELLEEISTLPIELASELLGISKNELVRRIREEIVKEVPYEKIKQSKEKINSL